jgi:UDP:flavonoid glycosyltransferase YjiC (YdhE family)
VAFFSMTEAGHFQLLRPLISGLVQRGIEAHVFTDRRFQTLAESAGGKFVDLFARYPLEEADGESLPVPCRFVSFAGCYAEEIARDLERISPSLIVYDTFAMIGRVAGRLLGVPYVNVCPGHNMDPARFLPLLAADPRVSISPSCGRAVETLRDRYGIPDASPFSYLSGLSPFLNVYCEPPAFLTLVERRAFEPVAFHGSLPSIEEIEARRAEEGQSCFGRDDDELKVYVSFGTVVWRYWAAEALDALKAISEFVGDTQNARAVISLGGARIGAKSVRALTKPSVAVSSYVDQWSVLREADVFFTHHGLNSTHEAIFNGVPMISYPFFSDQPALAEKCQQFGLAIPLTDSPRGQITEEHVSAAMTEFTRRRESMRASLTRAREWELRVIADRESILRRITNLIET